MILNWYNVPVTQSDVVRRIYGGLVDRAASADAISFALSGTAYDRTGREVNLSSEWSAGAPDPQLLVGVLARRQPVLVIVDSARSMFHAVVLTGAEYTIIGNRVRITSITFRDPRAAFPGRYSADARRLSGAALDRFTGTISGYYLITVSDSP